MIKLNSEINTNSEIFLENKKANLDLLEKLKSKASEIDQGGGLASRNRHTSRGKLLPRDRISNLLDLGSPFLKLENSLEKNSTVNLYRVGAFCWYWQSEWFEAMIVCNDATVRGTYFPSCKKHLRAQKLLCRIIFLVFTW